MYTAPQQEHDLPHRQPSFIGLPPISPGPEFGPALGISSAEFGLAGDDARDRDRDHNLGLGRRAASPRQLPSPHPWIDGVNVADTTSQPNATHPRADHPSPSMNSYYTQPTSAYRPSQGQSMHLQGAYTVPQPQAPPPPGQQFAQGQYTVTVNGNNNGNGHGHGHGHGFQEQQQQMLQQQQFGQPGSQNGGQYAVESNGLPQQQYQQQQIVQHGSQYAIQNGQSSFAGNPHASKAPAAYQQFAASSGAPRGMPSPSLAQNGTFILPPGWKAEESHLQQPLSSPRHRGSPSISSMKQQPPRDAYEIDKETGALSTRSVSPPTHSPVDMRQLQQGTPGSSQLNGYARPNPSFAQQDQGASGSFLDQPSQNAFAPPNPPFAQQGQGAPLGRTSTNNTQGTDRPDSKRSSRVFSSIRNRLGGNASDDVTGDGVSDASVLSDEQPKNGPSSLFGLRGNEQPASEGRPSYDPGSNPESSYFHAPSDKKRNFFSRANGGMGLGSSGQDQPSRPATSESFGGMSGIGGMSSPPPIVGFGPSVPRKNRFSKLTGMLNRDAKSEDQLSQPQGLNFAQGPLGRPSLTGQRPFQEMQMGPPGGPLGEAQTGFSSRSRAGSAATEQRPSLADQGRNQSAQGLMSSPQQPPPMGPVGEEDRGRKVSAGNLLSKFIGKRSESKTREQQGQQAAPGLGQPQGMMNQGLTPPRPGQPGQFPSFLAHSMGMPGQPPVLPPQGQYAGLAQQVHQHQHQQQLSGQPQPPLGFSPGRLGAYLQGGPSPGISPVTQSSASPFTAQPPGPLNVDTRQGTTPQPSAQALPQQQQQNQGPQSPVGIVQIATAVPIRQVERSPNSNSGGFSGQNSPQDSSRGRSASASVVNQIEVTGPRRPILDSQGRIRSGSSAASQQSNAHPQHPVHIASLQAPVRKPDNSSSPRNIAYLGLQDSSSIDTEKHGSIGHSSQDSPNTRRVSQTAAYHSQSASQTTPSTSPAPSQEQQPGPPHASQKSIDLGLARQYQPDQNQPSAPSPSIYRPSVPQPVFAVQRPVQPPPSQWGAANRGQPDFQSNDAGQPGQPPAQYTMQGRPPQDMMMMSTPPQEQNPDKEGAFSRMLKTSKTFVQERTSSEKPKSEREKLGAKLLGAFKKSRQAEATSLPPPIAPPGPPGGPAWGTVTSIQPVQRPPPPAQSQSAPLPTQHVVTEGLQQMPSKAQQLLGQPPNAMYQAPADQPPPKARRPSTERANSQPYHNYQEEREAPGKTTPPLSPDHIGATPVGAASQAPPRAPSPSGRPSTSSLPPGPGPQGMPPKQQQQPTQPRQSSEDPMAGIAAAHHRAKNLKQQIVPHDQQYAPVAIPQAYAPVYAGQAATAPVVNASTYAQPMMMPYQAQQQQWMQPSMMQGMIPGQLPPHMIQQGVYPQHPPYQGTTPPPMMNAGYQPPQQYMHVQQTTPTPPVQGQMPPTSVPTQQPMQQSQGVQQNVQQPLQQPTEQSLPRQVWQEPIMAPPSAQVQQIQPDPQQTPTPPQQASFMPSQHTMPVQLQQVQPPPTADLPAVPTSSQQFAETPGVMTASAVQTSDVETQIHRPLPVKSISNSLSNQTIPQSAFAVQVIPEQDQLQPLQSSNGDLMPQRQTSGASQVSSLTTEPATNKGSPDIQRDQVVQPVQTPEYAQIAQPTSLERQRAPVTPKDEALPKVDAPVISTPVDNDDLYGATPRHSATVAQTHYPIEHVVVAGPTQPSATDESESKFAGMPASMIADHTSEPRVASPAQQHFVVESPPAVNEPKSASPSTATSPLPLANQLMRSKSPLLEEEPPSPTESELKPEEAGKNEANNDGKITTINGKPVQSSQEIFDEHKRKQLVRDMEEKIAIMPEPEMLEPPKKKTDDVPMMSATSYPGQEWNPYGDGFEEDDE